MSLVHLFSCSKKTQLGESGYIFMRGGQGKQAGQQKEVALILIKIAPIMPQTWTGLKTQVNGLNGVANVQERVCAWAISLKKIEASRKKEERKGCRLCSHATANKMLFLDNTGWYSEGDRGRKDSATLSFPQNSIENTTTAHHFKWSECDKDFFERGTSVVYPTVWCA